MKQGTNTTNAQGITIENALSYVDEIVRVAKQEYVKLPIEKRAFVLELISSYLCKAYIHLHHFKEDRIKDGKAQKTTTDQRNYAFHKAFQAVLDSDNNTNSTTHK